MDGSKEFIEDITNGKRVGWALVPGAIPPEMQFIKNDKGYEVKSNIAVEKDGERRKAIFKMQISDDTKKMFDEHEAYIKSIELNNDEYVIEFEDYEDVE